jgi:hypothetical protein
MALISQDRTLSKVYSNYPFLRNFPFQDFQIEASEVKKPQVDDGEVMSMQSTHINPFIINFVYSREKQKTAISVFDRELDWLSTRAESITELDDIVRIINESLPIGDIIKKRDAVLVVEHWLKKIADDRATLNYSTFNDILMRLIGVTQLKETVQLINNINKLSSGASVIRMDRKQYDIIMTYYDFQLIYCKLVLGIIIAAKISL